MCLNESHDLVTYPMYLKDMKSDCTVFSSSYFEGLPAQYKEKQMNQHGMGLCYIIYNYESNYNRES